MAAALGSLVSMVWVLATNHAERLRREDDGVYREFRGLLAEIHENLSRIGARIRKRPRADRG